MRPMRFAILLALLLVAGFPAGCGGAGGDDGDASLDGGEDASADDALADDATADDGAVDDLDAGDGTIPAGFWVTAYYPTWAISKIRPDQMDFRCLTHVIHFAGGPSMTDPYFVYQEN